MIRGAAKNQISISFVGATFAQGDEEDSVTINKPAGVQSGDLLILFIAYTGGNFRSPPPTGFSYLNGNLVPTSTQVRLAIAYKIAGSSEPSTYTISELAPGSSGSSNGQVISLVAYRGANTIHLIGNTSYSTSGSTTTASSIVPTNSGYLIGCFAKYAQETIVTEPTAMSQISGGAASNIGSIYIYEEADVPSGTTGNRSATWSGSSSGGAVLLQITNEPTINSPFVSVANSTSTTGSSSLTISKPANVQEGDLLVAFMVSGTTATWTGATDWVEVIDSTVRVAYKVATASEPISYTFSRSATGVASSGCIVALRGVSYTRRGAVSASQDVGTTSIINVPAVSVDSPYSYEMAFVADTTGRITPLSTEVTQQSGTYRPTEVINKRFTGVSPSYILYAQQVTAASSYNSSGRSVTGGDTASTRAVKLVFSPQ
jgi:hypothetical protein